MKLSIFKDIIRQIKNTRYRYLSIVAIVALGVLFFVGINAASPDMRITADDYFNSQNLYDFNLISLNRIWTRRRRNCPKINKFPIRMSNV